VCVRARKRSIGVRALACLALLLAACPRESEPPAARRASGDLADAGALNVVLITMDTTRADALGSYGQPRPITPNLDRHASEGVVFLQCVSSAPSTLPSHATLFTGRHPFVHGVRSNSGYVLADENATLAGDHRYNAACSATLAAGPGEPDAAEWRGQALEWLGADLAAPGRTPSDLEAKLEHWKQDPDLTLVRDRLDTLPEPERAAWRDLWAAVDLELVAERSAPR